MTEQEIRNKITEITNNINKIDTKETEGKKITKSEIRKRNKLKEELKKFELMLSQSTDNGADNETATNTNNNNNTGTGSTNTGGNDTKPPKTGAESKLEETEKEAQEAADAMNSEEEREKKTEDAKSAAETARDRANQIDANIEENVPTWHWREVHEMAPTDKAKRGFIIANHVLNRLGTTLGNVGAIVQNAGGSGGAKIKEHGGSYLDQYRQGKIEQAMANRKTKQNSLLQQQIDALVAIGVPENEARAIQNKLRNSAHLHKYNRLTNEQQVYIQGLLYNDTKGEISDAVLGNFIDQLMEGKNVSMEQAAVNVLTAAGIDNVDKIKTSTTDIAGKVANWLGWKKYGE